MQKYKRGIVVVTGAGISVDSGLQTFSGNDGLWDGHDISDVATENAWEKNPKAVLDFYNSLHKKINDANPNAAHIALSQLQEKYKINVITQNIDDLHERAGSKNVIHLHGNIRYSQSSWDANLIYKMRSTSIQMGDFCDLGSQLRPHVIFYGEPVPFYEIANKLMLSADIVILIGSSLRIPSAKALVEHAPKKSTKYVVDINIPHFKGIKSFKLISQQASIGVPMLVDDLLK